jgi:signal transduction histidine kinase
LSPVGNFFKLRGNSRGPALVPPRPSDRRNTLEASPAASGPPPDAAILTRVQQENQRQIVGKLLHDLRNPVHSIRISMELFGRLARREGDFDKLMTRAAAYIDPAEAAVASLVANSERLAKYVAGPAAAELAPVPVDELLTEVAALLKASKRRLQATCALANGPALSLRADRIRVCHVLLHTCFNNPAPVVALSVRAGAAGLVVLDVAFQAGATDDAARANPLRAEELQTIVETAGGAVLTANATALSLEFRRADSPVPG